jgi:hypothetical protein
MTRLALVLVVAATGCKSSDKPRLVPPSCVNPAATLDDGAWKDLGLAELRAGTESSFCVGTASVNLHYANQAPDAVVKRVTDLVEGKGWKVLPQPARPRTGSAAWPVELIDRDYVKDKRWIKLRAMHYPQHEGAPVHVVVGILTGTPPVRP